MLELLPALMGGAGKLIDLWQQKRNENYNPIAKRVKDAQAAGVHPIYALGANVGESPRAQVAFGDTFAKMGQSLADTNKQKTGDQTALQKLTLEKAGLENELLRAQINKMNGATVPTLPAITGDRYMLEGQNATNLGSVPGTMVQAAQAHKISTPQWTPNLTLGVPYRTNPYFSDMQTLEDRYGEGTIASHLLSLGVGAGDLYWNRPAIMRDVLERMKESEDAAREAWKVRPPRRIPRLDGR